MTTRTTSDDGHTGSTNEDEDVTLRTRVPSGHIDQLHRRKVMTGTYIQEIVKDALEAHLDIPADEAPQPDGGDAADQR